MPTTNGFAALADSLKPRAEAIAEETASSVVSRAGEHSRYDTSPGREKEQRPHMRDEWTAEAETDTRWIVYNPVDYTIHNEFGTVNMTAQPMLHPAMDEEKPIFAAKLKGLFA